MLFRRVTQFRERAHPFEWCVAFCNCHSLPKPSKSFSWRFHLSVIWNFFIAPFVSWQSLLLLKLPFIFVHFISIVEFLAWTCSWAHNNTKTKKQRFLLFHAKLHPTKIRIQLLQFLNVVANILPPPLHLKHTHTQRTTHNFFLSLSHSHTITFIHTCSHTITFIHTRSHNHIHS